MYVYIDFGPFLSERTNWQNQRTFNMLIIRILLYVGETSYTDFKGGIVLFVIGWLCQTNPITIGAFKVINR